MSWFPDHIAGTYTIDNYRFPICVIIRTFVGAASVEVCRFCYMGQNGSETPFEMVSGRWYTGKGLDHAPTLLVYSVVTEPFRLTRINLCLCLFLGDSLDQSWLIGKFCAISGTRCGAHYCDVISIPVFDVLYLNLSSLNGRSNESRCVDFEVARTAGRPLALARTASPRPVPTGRSAIASGGLVKRLSVEQMKIWSR